MMIKCIYCRQDIGEPIDKNDEEAEIHICQKCSRLNVIKQKMEIYKPFIQRFSDIVNNTVFDHDMTDSEAIARLLMSEHRSLQADMVTFVRKVLSQIGNHAGDTNYEDPRNAWALEWCEKASNIL